MILKLFIVFFNKLNLFFNYNLVNNNFLKFKYVLFINLIIKNFLYKYLLVNKFE